MGHEAMIHPTCAQVLATIQTTFEGQIVPLLADAEARSAAATISHLLRHVALRIESEGQILQDDAGRLEVLLGRIADWFEQSGTGDPAAIRAATGRKLPSGVYPGLALMGEQVLALRAALVDAQERLHALAENHGGDPAYADLRQAIRDYIGAQLADEAKLIEPAFLGKGPRR
jgi:hypothetical protein